MATTTSSFPNYIPDLKQLWVYASTSAVMSYLPVFVEPTKSQDSFKFYKNYSFSPFQRSSASRREDGTRKRCTLAIQWKRRLYQEFHSNECCCGQWPQVNMKTCLEAGRLQLFEPLDCNKTHRHQRNELEASGYKNSQMAVSIHRCSWWLETPASGLFGSKSSTERVGVDRRGFLLIPATEVNFFFSPPPAFSAGGKSIINWWNN